MLTMDDKLREKLGIALGEAEYALLELKTFGLARIEVAESHIESVVVLLDEVLKNPAWGERGGPRDKQH